MTESGNHLHLDQIHIRDLRCRCIIGVNADERREKQDIVIHVTMYANLQKACTTDDIHDSVDYRAVKKDILKIVETSQFRLVEALAEALHSSASHARWFIACELRSRNPARFVSPERPASRLRGRAILMSDTPETAVAFIGVGSNIEPETNIVAALEILLTKTVVTQSSTFYRTIALGQADQPDFFNGVWQIETTMSPIQAKSDILHEIEKRLGRVRTANKFAPRTIDLDLLLYNDMATDGDALTLPHPDLERPFIYVPTLELLQQMNDGQQGPLVARMKALLPSGTLTGEPGRPLEDFTSQLRELLR